MKQLITIISFIIITLNGYCDTIGYYHVYINDSLIEQFNTLSDKPSIYLKQSELKNDDVITVRYGTDLYCIECVYVLSVFIEVKEKTPKVETTENFGKLSIPIKDLRHFQKKYGINKYHFNYHVRANTSTNNENYLYLFELNFI